MVSKSDNQLWWKGDALWTPAAQRIQEMLDYFKCKSLSKRWYFDPTKNKVIHVCKVQLDAQGYPTHIGTLNLDYNECDTCGSLPPEQVMMVAKLQKLNG